MDFFWSDKSYGKFKFSRLQKRASNEKSFPRFQFYIARLFLKPRTHEIQQIDGATKNKKSNDLLIHFNYKIWLFSLLEKPKAHENHDN